MRIERFINNFQNHPILFIGTGMSLRYLENSFSWEHLLYYISEKVSENTYHFQDLKNKTYSKKNKSYDYPKLASYLEKELDQVSEYKPGINRPDYINEINKIYYKKMQEGVQTSRIKIFISQILNNLNYRQSMQYEINQLKKARKNIACIITTNYDNLIEDIFNFKPLIGNNILLSNPYGSVYKIHGSVGNPDSIVINKDDYEEFNEKYELIKAQLISLFIHNPIIFLGYSISDNNIKGILETIFSYVDYEDELSEKIRSNFLLVEYKEGSKNDEVTEHDVNINDTVIRINKLMTDDYIKLYDSLADLRLPISAMEIRKVRNIVGDIYKGGSSKDIPAVRITEDIEELENSDKVLAIGTEKTINYEFRTIPEMILEYFQIIEENNFQILDTIDKQTISKNQYFPVFAFSQINNNIEKSKKLKENQLKKIKQIKSRINNNCKKKFSEIEKILELYESPARQDDCIIWNVIERNISIEEFKEYIQAYEKLRNLGRAQLLKSSQYKKLICVYDYLQYHKNI